MTNDGFLNLTDAIEEIVDYSDCKFGETMECLVEYVDMIQNVRNRDLRGIVSCDVSELARFATLPGITRISADLENGFRTIWNSEVEDCHRA